MHKSHINYTKQAFMYAPISFFVKSMPMNSQHCFIQTAEIIVKQFYYNYNLNANNVFNLLSLSLLHLHWHTKPTIKLLHNLGVRRSLSVAVMCSFEKQTQNQPEKYDLTVPCAVSECPRLGATNAV